MKVIKRILHILLILVIVFYGASCAKDAYEYVTFERTVTYELHELSPGVYGYYTAVTSNIPAENYEMVTLCLNGDILTLKGHVNIHYTDDDNTLVWKDINVVHGDTFDIYVPYGSIEIRPSLTQS